MPVFVLVVLCLTLVGFAVTSLLGFSPAWAALAGAVVLGVRALARARHPCAESLAAADVPFLAFVLCLGVVVEGLMLHGLDIAMRGVLPSGDTLLALLGIAAVAAVLSNIVNNLPAVLVLLPLVDRIGSGRGAGGAARRQHRTEPDLRRARWRTCCGAASSVATSPPASASSAGSG